MPISSKSSQQACRPLQRMKAWSVLILLLCAVFARGGDAFAGSRLVATGGVSQVEGSAGGGLTPWALIGGYGTRDEIGGSAFVTRLVTNGGFGLTAVGAAIGVHDRLEMSFARQDFSLGSTVPGARLGLDVIGLKVRLAGDAVHDQDTHWPQVAAGIQYKRQDADNAVAQSLGARRLSGVDLYLSATKLWIGAVAGRNLLVSAGFRSTSANQFGLLGFGGPRGNRSIHPEVSAGLFLTDRLIVGAEYRGKPDNLSTFGEQAARDVFVAWFPYRSVAVTLARVDLGRIADKADQRAVYLSVHVTH